MNWFRRAIAVIDRANHNHAADALIREVCAMTDPGRLHGLFVPQLTDEELVVFDRMVREGRARRSYQGLAGFMGVARVEIVELEDESPQLGER